MLAMRVVIFDDVVRRKEDTVVGRRRKGRKERKERRKGSTRAENRGEYLGSMIDPMRGREGVRG
jgi:hypothetical protein